MAAVQPESKAIEEKKESNTALVFFNLTPS